MANLSDKIGPSGVLTGDQGVSTTDGPSFAGLTVDTDTLYVDSTNNRVGIGTSSPATALHVAGNTTFGGAIDETVYALSGTAPALDPSNGTILTWTLTGNSTPTAGTWAAGQAITLLVDDGSDFTITWTTLAVVWKTDGGSAPTLNTSGDTVIALWKVGTTIYGARVGDA